MVKQRRPLSYSNPHLIAEIARFLAARLIKVVGNFTKAFSYIFWHLIPRKRFRLPHSAKPLIARASKHRIPKIIWQTNHADEVTIAVFLNYLFNRMMAPSYEYRFMDDAAQEEFVRTCFPGIIFEAYSKLQIGAARADLWRVLVLQKFGGVYLDIDAHLVWPLGYIIEPSYEELYVRHRNQGLMNYFIASVKDNPHLDGVVAAIVDNITQANTNNVFDLTGPGVLNRILAPYDVPTANFRTTCIQGTFTNEFFQYVDHSQGKWTRVQQDVAVIKS
jgi:mannosyltransferase OCH1-like enzyme